jgi:formyl-CoA transferase/CoA:oxalate CoA-transferase
MFGDLGRVLSMFGEHRISSYHLAHSRGKRSITINLKTDEGREIVRRMVPEMDVFVQNFRPGVMERLGLGYDDLRAQPRLVYCSITAFGQSGPMAQNPAWISSSRPPAVMAHTGEENGPPIKSAPPVADLNTGVYAAYAILGALFARERSGAGQHVHVAMLDAVLSLFADNAANVLTEGTRFGRFGSGHPDLVPYRAFRPATAASSLPA